MSFAKVFSAQTFLLQAHVISVEVDLSHGLYAFSIVGLPDKAVEESRDRVCAAIKNSGFASPKSKNHKVVISLAPAHLKKEGPAFDIAIALAYLRASEDIAFDPQKKLFLGELSLDGKLRAITGVLPLTLLARKKGFSDVFIPFENAREAALVDGINIFPAETLLDIISHLNTKRDAASKPSKILSPEPQTQIPVRTEGESTIDFSDIRGQETAKRGLEIAAAGGHNIALFGPAGTGKTMLARAFCTILPPLSFEEVLETTAIHSVAGEMQDDLVSEPPFRSPHHTASYTSMVGGGTFPRPGEITLAHKGVLFLDEFPEFEKRVIEALRQPLEDRVISITRTKGSARFPANFVLLAALNPCPCGNYGSTEKCICSPLQLLKYRQKLSGPIMDRIDLWIEAPKVAYETLTQKRETGSESASMRARVLGARNRQDVRFSRHKTNSEMSARDIETFLPLSPSLTKVLSTAAERMHLSARSYHRVLKVARTIADLTEKEDIEQSHLMEALQYRPKKFAE